MWYGRYMTVYVDLSITVQIKSSPPPQCVSAGQNAGPLRHSSHQPLWTQSAKITAESIGHGKITGVSPLSGISWTQCETKTTNSGFE